MNKNFRREYVLKAEKNIDKTQKNSTFWVWVRVYSGSEPNPTPLGSGFKPKFFGFVGFGFGFGFEPKPEPKFLGFLGREVCEPPVSHNPPGRLNWNY